MSELQSIRLLIEFIRKICPAHHLGLIVTFLTFGASTMPNSSETIAAELKSVATLTAKVTSTHSIGKLQSKEISARGLSGLAWNQDDQILYAVSDFGDLYHFKIQLSGDQIDSVAVIAMYPLLDHNGSPLKGVYNDAEGLEILNGRNGNSGDESLIVVFERKPRLVKYLPNGIRVGDVAIAERFTEKENYHKPNKSLETALNHSKLGLLIGSEVPMSGENSAHHQIFSLNGDSVWSFAIGPHSRASFTGMAELDDGNILVLERSFDNIAKPFFIALRIVDMINCAPGQVCESETLLELNSVEELELDNFEGLAKLDNRRYLMVSDNNANPFQKTLLQMIVIE